MYCRQHRWRVRKKGDGSKMLKENGEVRMAVIASRIYLLRRITVVEFRLELEVKPKNFLPGNGRDFLTAFLCTQGE